MTTQVDCQHEWYEYIHGAYCRKCELFVARDRRVAARIIAPVEPNETPINLTLEEARALTEGSLAMICRPLRTQPLDVLPCLNDWEGRYWVSLMQRNPNHGGLFRCRYGLPGDRLWGRERWWHMTGTTVPEGKKQHFSSYEALMKGPSPDRDGTWQPARTMPRELCRIEREIVQLRCVRVQDIDYADLCALSDTSVIARKKLQVVHEKTHRAHLVRRWAAAVTKPELAYEANPWAWLISLKQVEAQASEP